MLSDIISQVIQLKSQQNLSIDAVNQKVRELIQKL